jgi:hypothetical protein
MTSSIAVSHKQETVETLAPSANRLPVRAWRNTIGYLSEKEQDPCALVCKRLAILVICDPSADLEGMDKRKKTIPLNRKKLLPVNYLRQILGPTGRFLFNHPSPNNPLIQSIHESIHEEMNYNPNVDNLVRKVCKIESMHPGYIPIYHGTRIEACASMEFIRRFLLTPYLEKTESFPCLNPMIKFPSPNGPKTIGEALGEFPPGFWDSNPSIRKELLSCNPFLFANFYQNGESTWDYYLHNDNVHKQSVKAVFLELCETYQIEPNQTYLDQLEAIHKELCLLAIDFARQNLPEKIRHKVIEGLLLQILIPSDVLDKVAYASLAYGVIQKSDKPLSKRCLELRQDPDSQPLMQIRLLVQSIFIPDYRIKVITHGCGDFFSKCQLKPESMKEADWVKQEKRLLRKEEILQEASQIFKKMILRSPKKQKKPASELQQSTSITPKTFLVPCKALEKRASMDLPHGFSVQPFYNERRQLVKVVQTDNQGQETIYLPALPKTVRVTREALTEKAKNSPASSVESLSFCFDERDQIECIWETDREGWITIYTCNEIG